MIDRIRLHNHDGSIEQGWLPHDIEQLDAAVKELKNWPLRSFQLDWDMVPLKKLIFSKKLFASLYFYFLGRVSNYNNTHTHTQTKTEKRCKDQYYSLHCCYATTNNTSGLDQTVANKSIHLQVMPIAKVERRTPSLQNVFWFCTYSKNKCFYFCANFYEIWLSW